MMEKTAYDQAIQSGRYVKPTGLIGKYDNVRRLWEDEVLRLSIAPYLEPLVAQRNEQGEKLRILDLGCGSGDGLELLLGVKKCRARCDDHAPNVIGLEELGFYKGIDINSGLLEQAKRVHRDKDNLVFVQGDFNELDLATEEPYDVYLASYGTLSHNSDEQTVTLLSNIAQHGRKGALIVCDWLGRYSYEWQTLWTRDLGENQYLDYVISYIHPDGVEKQDLTPFPLRLLSRREAFSIYRRARQKAVGGIRLRKLFDRSSLVGRHIDTAQYNPRCQPLRRRVNSLFELDLRTDLEGLLVEYVPKEGFPKINAYYETLQMCWNELVAYTWALLSGSGSSEKTAVAQPSPLNRAMLTMKEVISRSAKLTIGDPRANLIEPQLGYCFRELEMGLQKGQGCGHGIVAIFEVLPPL